MIKIIFYSLLTITLVLGIFFYFNPSLFTYNFVKKIWLGGSLANRDSHALDQERRLNILTGRGLNQIRQELEYLAQEQVIFLDRIAQQQRLLKEIRAINYQDNYQLKVQNQAMVQFSPAVLAQQSDSSLPLGQGLVALDNKINANRQWLMEQIDSKAIKDFSKLKLFQERYQELKAQSAELFDTLIKRNENMLKAVDRYQGAISILGPDSLRKRFAQENIKAKMRQILQKERDDWDRLRQMQDRNRDLLASLQDRYNTTKDLYQDAMERTRASIERERNRQEQQRSINEQRQVEQKQRMEELQDHRKNFIH